MSVKLNDNVAFKSATELAGHIRQKEFSCRDLLELYISRIERFNPTLNCVVTTNFDDARAQADQADAEVSLGKTLGPLHGLPITVKDALETAGIQSTGGARELMGNIPERDAPVVKAVKGAGAIVMAKTNLPRWSGDLQTFNDIFGTTNNPWDLDRVPGGSSGGAAAAVAAGLTAFEIGTDIGGSIRYPSSFCGVFGHKPSFGIVPSRGYLDHEFGGLNEADVNVVGPIARSAEDLEMLLNVMRRRDAALQASLELAPPLLEQTRVAVWFEDDFCPVERKALQVMEAAVARLQDSGVRIFHDAKPDLDPEEAFGVGSALVYAAVSQSQPMSSMQNGLSHRAWLDLNSKRERIRTTWAAFFQEYDAVLMPISPVSPFRHNQGGNWQTRTLISEGDRRPYGDLLRWTILTGMAYLPSSTPPIGLDEDGLPVSFQIVGRYGGDLTTIRLAQHLARLGAGYQRPPIQ